MEKWNVIYASLCHKIQGCLKSSSHVGHGRLQADCCDFVAGKSIFGVDDRCCDCSMSFVRHQRLFRFLTSGLRACTIAQDYFCPNVLDTTDRSNQDTKSNANDGM
jgi:hypothetical protein